MWETLALLRPLCTRPPWTPCRLSSLVLRRTRHPAYTRAAGLTIAGNDDEAGCFDGATAGRHRTDICVAPPKKPKSPSKPRSRRTGGPAEGVSSTALLAVLLLVVLPLAALTHQRFKQWQQVAGQPAAVGAVPPPVPGERWRHPVHSQPKAE